MSSLDTVLHHIASLPDALIYLSLGVSAFIENIFPPIPGDIITAFGAFLVGAGKISFVGVYSSTTAGSLVGFLTLFYLSRFIGRRFFMEGNYRFLKAEKIIKAEQWFVRHGYLLVLMNRFFPGIRSAISVAGGISRLSPYRVTLAALISCAAWNLIWISMGYMVGSRWEVVRTEISALIMRYHLAVAAFFALLFTVYMLGSRYGGKRAIVTLSSLKPDRNRILENAPPGLLTGDQSADSNGFQPAGKYRRPGLSPNSKH